MYIEVEDTLAAADGGKKNSNGIDDEQWDSTTHYDADDEDDVEDNDGSKQSEGINLDGNDEDDEDEDEAQLLKLQVETESVTFLSDMPSTACSALVTVTRSSSYGTFQSQPLSKEEMECNLHERWAQSAPKVNLSGSWTLIADDVFKKEYDLYLSDLGFNRIIRSVACSLISRTKEITKQSDNGRELYIKSINPKGTWERVLTSSGFPDFETESDKTDYSQHKKTKIKTAESEEVTAEAWWECHGTRHRSCLRGGKKGDYESLRYLEDCGGNMTILVCESIFHPCGDVTKKRARVKWRFQRDA
ncbi:hypothetical protein ACHAWT_002598 [Skeletonema menzelii]